MRVDVFECKSGRKDEIPHPYTAKVQHRAPGVELFYCDGNNGCQRLFSHLQVFGGDDLPVAIALNPGVGPDVVAASGVALTVLPSFIPLGDGGVAEETNLDVVDVSGYKVIITPFHPG